MILENFTALEICVFVALIIFGIAILIGIIAPTIYAWADRWIDRTRNVISDKVVSEPAEKGN